MVTQILSLFSGLATVILVGVFLLIARFYQRTSGEASGYSWFIASAILLLAAGGRDWWISADVTDPWANGLRFLGGALLFISCSRLFRQMTARQRQ